MKEELSNSLLAGLLALSGALHGGAYVSLGAISVPVAEPERPPTSVEIVSPPPPPAPPPPPVTEPDVESPPPPPVEPPRPRPRPEARREQPPPEAPPPPPAAEEQIAEFGGETLTVNGPGGWRSAVGNGQTFDGPIGGPTGQTTGRRREGAAEGTPGGTGREPVEAIVPLADLRQPPRPPDSIRDEMVRAYPARLRALSLEGTATVSAIVRADGSLTRIRVSRASEAEFGEACAEALRRAGAWGAGVGPDGRNASTRIAYNCEFGLHR